MNAKGKTCTFAAAGDYKTPFMLTISDVGQSSADMTACPATNAANEMNDGAALAALAGTGMLNSNMAMMGGRPFDATVTAPVCVAAPQGSGAASLVPGMMLMGLVAAVVA